MLKEFKEFAMKGNIVDLAIGVIIGAAFGKIIDSLVKDVLMPPIGKLLGGVDFSNLFLGLSGGPFPSLKAAQDAGAATLNYGLFINAVINFLIIAFSLFMVVKAMNAAKRGNGRPDRTDHEELPAMPDGNPHQGSQVRALHQFHLMRSDPSRRVASHREGTKVAETHCQIWQDVTTLFVAGVSR